MINLGLAVFWLVVALGVFISGGTGFPLAWAWVPAFFCCYNLLRWWLSRLQKRDRAVMKQIAQRMRRPTEERNPDFDFGDDAADK
jgi:hypothetical protein